MSHEHTHTKAEAIQQALQDFEVEQHHKPDAHEKARVMSDAVKQWEHEEIEIRQHDAH